jgi:hypothetical protein
VRYVCVSWYLYNLLNKWQAYDKRRTI